MRKFIVTADGIFKFGDVNMHKDLLVPAEACIGGGEYEFDYLSSKMSLWGKSYDFGSVKWSFIDKLLLPECLRGIDIDYCELPISDFVESIGYY